MAVSRLRVRLIWDGLEVKLLIISDFWTARGDPISGVFVQEQIQAFAALGCELDVICPLYFRQIGMRRYRGHFGNIGVWSPTWFGVPARISGGDVAVHLNKRIVGRAIARVLKRHRHTGQFDAVLVNTWRYGALSAPFWRPLIKGPAVVTFHGVEPFMEQRCAAPWFRGHLEAAWGCYDHFVLVGSPLRSHADQLGISPESCSVIANGTDPPTEWNTRQRTRQETRIVLSVSNLIGLKGIDLNLRALAVIARNRPELAWTYRVVGDGMERRNLEALARTLGIAGRVTFLGTLPREETLREFADCDIFSLPSWGESFGIVYLEAMARGRPVIGVRGMGASDIVTHEVDGLLVEPHDVNTLTMALERLLESLEYCEALGRRGRSRAEAMTWQHNATAYLSLLSRLQSKRHPEAALAVNL
jgi:glycosyltransferase involved in cell wall biosynthesis